MSDWSPQQATSFASFDRRRAEAAVRERLRELGRNPADFSVAAARRHRGLAGSPRVFVARHKQSAADVLGSQPGRPVFEFEIDPLTYRVMRHSIAR